MANLAIRYGAALASAGHDVTLLCYAYAPDMARIDPANKVFHLGTGRARRTVGELKRFLCEYQPRALVSFPTFLNLAVIPACMWARQVGTWTGACVPVLTHPIRLAQQANIKDNVLAARLLYPFADAFVAISPEPSSEIASWPGVRFKAFAVAPPPLPQAASGVLSRWEEGNEPLFVTASRLVAVKRHDLLLDAFRKVLRTQPSARLVILGTGAEENHIRQRIAEIGLETSVDVLGFVDDPLEWMSRATAFVMASDEEGFGQVLVEAMSVGCPVVSTDALGGGPRYVLNDGAYGVLVPRGDRDALAAGMKRMLDPVQRRFWSEQAELRASRFSGKRVGTELAAFLIEVAS